MKVSEYKPNVIMYSVIPETKDGRSDCLWARFIFDCDNFQLNINSDAGDYSYKWSYDENESFMHLMSRINKDYLLSKISNRNIFDFEESKKEMLKRIESYDPVYCGIDSEEKWNQIKQEILDMEPCSEGYYLQTIYDLIPNIDFESIYVENYYPYEAKVIANMFSEYIQPIIKNKLNEKEG